MSNTIDILCVIDAVTLAENVQNGSINPGSQAIPTSLGSYSQSDVYVSMLTEGSYVTNDGGGSELTITCDVGDNIRWNITNPGAGVNYSCMLYQFSSASIGTNVSQPICLPLNVNLYINSASPNTGTPTPIAYTSSAWQTTALAACPSPGVQYSWAFQLINQSGTVLGYFSWDPFIVINV